MEYLARSSASHSGPYPAQTWSDSTNEMTSSKSADTITFLVTCESISLTPTGRRPRFLAKGINLQPKVALNSCVKFLWCKFF